VSDKSNVQLIDVVPDKSLSETFELIDQVAKNLRRIQRLTISESGLTPPQFQILRTLWNDDGIPLMDLASASNCSRATITGLIDVLERKGLVRRKPNPNDRRSLLAELTAEGRALESQAPELDQIYAQCCDVLAPDEMYELGLLLNKLNETLIF
jgi:MarR family 2-MHQ and catechol resistance regulon transcriptional repressor